MERIDTEHTDEVLCPYCGHVKQDSWELDDAGAIDCDCGKSYHFTSDTTRTFSSQRDCQLNGEKHKFEKVQKYVDGMVMEECSRCDEIRFVDPDPFRVDIDN